MRRARLARGLSLSGLADQLGVTKSYLSRLESGDRTATAEQVRKAAALLDLPEELLLLASGTLPDDVAAEVARSPVEVAAAVRQRNASR